MAEIPPVYLVLAGVSGAMLCGAVFELLQRKQPQKHPRWAWIVGVVWGGVFLPLQMVYPQWWRVPVGVVLGFVLLFGPVLLWWLAGALFGAWFWGRRI